MSVTAADTKVCRSCPQVVLWAVTPNGKRMPLNWPGETRYVVTEGADGVLSCRAEPTYISHFATCPQAAQFRRPKEEP